MPMHSYTVAKKVEVIQWHRENRQNVHQMSRHFKLDWKRIREWEKNFDNLLQQNYGKAKLRRKLSNGAPVFSEYVDDALFEFFERERRAGRAVSNWFLSEEAVKIASSMQLGNFVASSHLYKSVEAAVRRCNAPRYKREPEDAGGIFGGSNSLPRRYGYTLYNMANMDQTMVRIDNPANRTNNVIGESTIRIANTGCARRGFTVCLAACVTGQKLPAFIIFPKEQSGKIPARAFASLRIPVNVRLTATKNGWMTSEKMQEWLSRVWGPHVNDVRRLLVLDQAPFTKRKLRKMPSRSTIPTFVRSVMRYDAEARRHSAQEWGARFYLHPSPVLDRCRVPCF
ncbi:hypothetical protein HPB49_008606 [Dermacentor silvarum]|uniref:Uncharacterized protein n=1 Tax=Dermacentor silvarum TaxID=543639 RepID=A0ACB8C8G0_DERSI|nr:hypothetical protein HPB49_008606 [Dermacentor silvarum]